MSIYIYIHTHVAEKSAVRRPPARGRAVTHHVVCIRIYKMINDILFIILYDILNCYL